MRDTRRTELRRTTLGARQGKTRALSRTFSPSTLALLTLSLLQERAGATWKMTRSHSSADLSHEHQRSGSVGSLSDHSITGDSFVSGATSSAVEILACCAANESYLYPAPGLICGGSAPSGPA